MIDRIARNEMAEATRHYLTGLSTNFQFDDVLFRIKSADPAIAVIRNQLWFLYDDLQQHRAQGDWKPTQCQREFATRTILFLKSDLEYQWPEIPAWYRVLRPFIGLVTLGAGVRYLDRIHRPPDADDVWPFRTTDELRAARATPKYFASA